MKRSLRASIHSSDWFYQVSFAVRHIFSSSQREEEDARKNKKRNLRARERASAFLSPVSRDARNRALDSAPNSRVYALLSTHKHLITRTIFYFF
jgi:hypothetical protein